MVLANPTAGYFRYKKALQAAERQFANKEWQAEIRTLTSSTDLEESAKRTIKQKYWAVVVCGGDGTLNTAVHALAGSKVRLGLIPMGTGNGFARGFNLPFDPAEACRVIAAGKTRMIDVGYANKKAFGAVFGTGFDAWLAQCSDKIRFLTRLSGYVRYFTAGIIAFATYKSPIIRVSMGKTIIEKRCLLVAVANSKEYGLGASVCPDAIPDDGQLDLVLLEKVNLFRMLINVPRMFNHKALDGAHRLRGSSFKIEQISPGEALPFHVEGEVVGHLPVTITMKKKILKLLVP